MTETRLKNRIALITGASRGIGRATAKRLAAEGAHVLLLGRKQKSLEPVYDEITSAGGNASLIPLDLQNGAKIDALGPSLYERFGRLDIFVGNAAMLGGLRPLTHISAKTWDQVLATNLTANWLLIRTLDPLLRRSGAGRVVFVTSSGVAAQGRAYWAPYSVSKAGLETLAKTYANETADSTVKVNVVDPGATATGMRAEAYPGEDPSTIKTPDEAAQAILELCLPSVTDSGRIAGVS
ncbi:SDR family NAD(P)-dependent oxidoreductase [Methyloceanibacter sp.]|uniref:SDR family NAD(P)-dependent oxidoreductase n=1 Tax=Methyloceanibacter sp. TaxID=1965321 RepID=UPI0020813C94|nr:SDR family NAD(P)-dependent oxidoreductase [Methyloceanibacter sp.]GFO82451.1 MAG: oxidoreductase [Methyloceanibacter sp.]HML92144.1 SDR family NAD(P)-dependent oxidoreductase [Methyloceanibacter sp.]